MKEGSWVVAEVRDMSFFSSAGQLSICLSIEFGLRHPFMWKNAIKDFSD